MSNGGSGGGFGFPVVEVDGIGYVERNPSDSYSHRESIKRMKNVPSGRHLRSYEYFSIRWSTSGKLRPLRKNMESVHGEWFSTGTTQYEKIKNPIIVFEPQRFFVDLDHPFHPPEEFRFDRSMGGYYMSSVNFGDAPFVSLKDIQKEDPLMIYILFGRSFFGLPSEWQKYGNIYIHRFPNDVAPLGTSAKKHPYAIEWPINPNTLCSRLVIPFDAFEESKLKKVA